MTTPAVEPAPSGITRILTGLVEHSNQWGMVWFGLVFWGSVLNAIGTEVWPDANGWAVASVAVAIGLAAGIVAKVRGRWI